MNAHLDYRILEPTLQDYYQIARNCITFDSCEFSRRTEYICNLIEYLNTERGVVALALSNTSVSKNTLYMSYLPDAVRSVVYNLGLFHTYQKFVKIHEEALNLLYVDNRYSPIIEYMTLAVRSLQVQLIKKLKELLNCTIILDRSVFSSYLYSKTLTKDKNLADHSYVTKMQPLKSFFITSCKKLQIQKSSTSLKTYDQVKNINELLSQKIYDLESTVENFRFVFPVVLIREDSDKSNEESLTENMAIIKQHINEIL